MFSRKERKGSNDQQRQTVFQRISLTFYDRPRVAAILWLLIFCFGIASYTTFLNREGFPSITIPYTMVNGTYLVNDSAKVDKDIGDPLSAAIMKVDKVKRVTSDSNSNFYNVVVQFQDGTDVNAGTANVKKAVEAAHFLPSQATIKYQPLLPAVDDRGDDILVAFYSTNPNTSLQELTNKAQQAVNYLNSQHIQKAGDIAVLDPFAHATDLKTGASASTQKTFDRYAIRDSSTSSTQYFQSVSIGIKGDKGFNVLKLDKDVRAGLDSLNSNPKFAGYHSELSFGQASSIQDQIHGLQTSLLEGLTAVLVISAIMIALRASLITVGAMAVVLTSTLGVLYLIGYSLNTITLFSLVLSLSLIVDDTIIMVEAIDASRRRLKNPRDVVAQATRKISRAMLAATLTATLGFAPLIFVGGILGSFIRAIPITVIVSLLVSLFVALTFIPFLARWLLLRPKQLGHSEDAESPAHGIEAFIAKTISRPILWTQHHRKRAWTLGIVAVVVGLGFVVGGALIFQKVSFNIFAPAKDSDALTVAMTFPAGSTVQQNEKTADRADKIIGNTLGSNLKQLEYFNSGNSQTANINIDLISFKSRDVTSPELASKLEQAFAGFNGAFAKVGQQDVGPPTGGFTVNIETTNRVEAYKLANSIAKYLEGTSLKRPNGTYAHFKDVMVSNTGTVSRNDGKQYVSVNADFDGDDTSTLVLLAKSAVNKEYDSAKLAQFHLKSSNLVYDFGSESENQDSFKTLLIAFPLLLVVIYVLLILQFRSLLQPLLIFMAIPFSFFGITTGLWLTDNAFSFFTMLGFFALVGLSLKNTILLTDYANQSLRSGSTPIQAISIALQERFRPLIATSITAIVSLIPLYLSNPFWQGLAVTLMFGLLSSTFLVITVFPYYYLGAEYLRRKISRKTFFGWLILTALVIGALVGLKASKVAPLAPIITLIITIVYKKIRK